MLLFALSCSFTLPVVPSGFQAGGVGDITVKAIQQAGLTNYYINLMVMDYYGSGCPYSSCNMGTAAVQAATSVNTVDKVPYSKMELTPMIGKNDDPTSFTLADVDTLTNFAKANGVAGIHWWSFDRDTPCPDSTTDLALCNGGTSPSTWAFTNKFIANLPGWNNIV